MRVIFMGTPDFAVGTLEEIIKAGHEVVLVVSQPDKAVGRSKALRYTPVKACALEHGIEVYQPQKVRDSECIERLRTYHPDIIIVEAFGQIIPRAILDMPRYGCVNVHASIIAFRCRINSRCPGYTNHEFFIVSNQIRFNDNLWCIRSMTL